jgi:hypothetical protein
MPSDVSGGPTQKASDAAAGGSMPSDRSLTRPRVAAPAMHVADLATRVMTMGKRLPFTKRRLSCFAGSLATNASCDATVAKRSSSIKTRLATVDPQLATIETRFAMVDPQLATIEMRFVNVEERFATAETRLTRNDLHFATVRKVVATSNGRSSSSQTEKPAKRSLWGSDF